MSRDILHKLHHIWLTEDAMIIYIVTQKNDTNVAHYNFNAHQPILVVFGRDVAERVHYQMMIC